MTDINLDTAKTIRTEYGRGWSNWAEAKIRLQLLGYSPPDSAAILLGIKHLDGD